MSCIVRSYNKANNTTYRYESVSYRDPITKKPRSHRRCIGKLDPETGQIVPTGKRGRPKKQPSPAVEKSMEIKPGANSQAALVDAVTRLQEEQAQAKALDVEVRQLRLQMKQIKTAMGSLVEAANKILEICG